MIIGVMCAALQVMAVKNPKLAPSYAWTVSEPLGLPYKSTIDTLQYNFFREAIPSAVSLAYATTGNYGAEGQNQIFLQRPVHSDFFFEDALSAWLPTIWTQKYYNTRIPMTLMSYTTGGNKNSNQDRLQAVFSGNVNKAIEVGAAMDYLYSKGSYDYQADKDFTWRLFGSYMGDRYEMQAFFNNYNFLNKESGGITNDLYITDPAQVQGGVTTVDPKAIPTRLTAAHSRVIGHEFYMNHRYKVGYYHTWKDSANDTVVHKLYIPVTSFIWTMDYKTGKHLFLNQSATQDTAFFDNTYLKMGGTNDETNYWKLTNTVGISLLEGFNKYAKFGLAAYATYEMRKYTQQNDSGLYVTNRNPLLSAAPAVTIPHIGTENVAWVGGQLTKQQGSLLTYNATAQFGLVGSVVGDFSVTGDVTTKFKLWGDSVRITGYGYLKNEETPYLLRNYVSNHFIWKNDFGKVRRFRVGGKLFFPQTGTYVNVGAEDMQNYVYFGSDGMPTQYGDHVQVFSASVSQNLHYRAFNWNNQVIYQTSSQESVLPLPKLSVYSNLFLLFKISKVLSVQMGVDCNYYTQYYAPDYNPATMTFKTQTDKKCGNFAFMNAYANMKLSKTRFFVMFSHFNQGMFGGNDYFSIPHYPLNPRRLQIGVSVDFAN